MAGLIGGKLSGVMDQVAKAYPGLTPHLANATAQWGTPTGPKDDRQLEYYAPWESNNPNPGKSTVELYNRKLQGQDLTDSVALDMLHYVGGTNPQTNSPVDPRYYALKQQMGQEIGKANRKMDWEAYNQDTHQYGPQPYQDWLDKNRTDAYIRGIVSPRMNPEWQQPGMYTPSMSTIGDQIKAYLAGRK